MFGRDVRTLSKLFEEVVYSPAEYGELLAKLKEAVATKQKNIIKGLRY